MRDDAAQPEGATSRRLTELVHRAEPGPLLDEVERACGLADWGHLFVLRDRCARAAEELGKQLWPVAQYAEYRIALEAPGPLAGRVVAPGAARFALGPLTEVVASTHGWEELADHLGPAYVAATVAQERVVRGEDLRGDPRAAADELGLPLVLADFEPRYAVPTYRSHDVLEGGPGPQRGPWEPCPGDAGPGDGAPWEPAVQAAHELVGHWESGSTGVVSVAALAGPAPAAVAAVCGAGELARIDLDDGLARLVWAGASGAARGRRRGLAAGRSSAWWLLHGLTGLPWPASAGDLGEAAAALGWYAVRTRDEQPGWSLRLAIESANRSRTLVIDATDRDGAADGHA